MELPKTGKTFAYVNTEKSFFKKTFWNIDKEYEQMCYRFKCLEGIRPHWLFHAGFEEIR